MKYGDLKIFKFSTISKKINRITDNFSGIYKNVKIIQGYAADLFRFIIKYIFSGIYKNVKTIQGYAADLFRFIIKYIFPAIYKNVKIIQGYAADLFRFIIKYIFSGIYKNVNTIQGYAADLFRFIIKYIFPAIYKNVKIIQGYAADLFRFIIKYIFSGIYKSIKLAINVFSKIYKNVNFKRYNLFRIYRYLDFRRYNFSRIYRRAKIVNYNNLVVYFFVFLIFSGLLYVTTPMFFNYNKSDIEKMMCKNQNIECSIKGKINYSFLPTPRIVIKDLIIQDFYNKKNTLVKVENAIIKLSITNLLDTKKQNFKKIELKNFVINFNLKNIKKYKNFNVKKNNFIPLILTKGKIKFFDEKNYIATINDANINLSLGKSINEAVLKGKFLDDDIYISIDNKKIDNLSINITLKMSDLNLLTKVSLFTSDKAKNKIRGKILLKKDKNKLTAIFNYNNYEITIAKSNLRNVFLDGKLEGTIKFLPYFDFNLDVNLNSINFSRLHSYLSNLEEKNKKNLLKINKKINGKLNLSTDKIYSKHNLVNSFESRIKFTNGNILIEQLLLNLGKLGAADVLGVVDNSNKITNFKFESNIYLDNQRKFFSKFGIYNKQSISSSLFISGSFNLEKLRTSLYEISDDKKFSYFSENCCSCKLIRLPLYSLRM